MNQFNVSLLEVEQLRDKLALFTALLHLVLKKTALSKDPKFLHQIQETICSLNKLSKL